MNILVENISERIGDTLCIIPAILALAERFWHSTIYLYGEKETRSLLKLIEGKNIYVVSERPQNADIVYTLNNAHAFDHGYDKGLHHTQSAFVHFNLPIPTRPIRPLLKIKQKPAVFKSDFVLAPFSRSLEGTDQMWPKENWEALVKRLPQCSFYILGDSHFGDEKFFHAKNAKWMFSYAWPRVIATLEATNVLITLNNGISHLAYARGVRAVLLSNQPPFTCNPEAFILNKQRVADMSVDFVLKCAVDSMDW